MSKFSAKYLLCVMVSGLFVSCSGLEQGPIREGTAGPDGEWFVSAAFRTSVQSRIQELDDVLYWQEGDQVALKAVSGSSAPVESVQTVLTLNKIDSGLESVKFKGTVTMTEQPEKCYFAYPADAQIAKSGAVTFDFTSQSESWIHKPFLYGSADYDAAGIECVLKHAAAMIRLKVPAGVTRVEISSNALAADDEYNEKTHGISRVVVEQDGTVTVTQDASDKISAEVTSSGVNYIFVPAIEFIDGFSICMFNDTDNSVMLKSYSVDGGKYSSYSFEPGSVMDIDLSGDNAPEPIRISCVVAPVQNHTFDNGILTGTDVYVSSMTVSGVTSKVIDMYGVAVYEGKFGVDPDAVLVRFWYASTLPSSNILLGPQNNWDLLLPDREYNVYAICRINGRDHYVHAGELGAIPQVTGLSLGLSADTSYTIYESMGAEYANNADGYSISDITATVNVTSSLLNNAYYSFNMILTSDKNDKVVKTYSDNVSSSINVGSWSDFEVGTHSIYGTVSFAGAEDTESVTGIPVTGIGSNSTYNVGTLNNSSFSKTYYLPESTPLSVTVSGTVTGQGGAALWASGKTTNCTLTFAETNLGTWSATGERAGIGAGDDVTNPISGSYSPTVSGEIALSISADNDNANISSLVVNYR